MRCPTFCRTRAKVCAIAAWVVVSVLASPVVPTTAAQELCDVNGSGSVTSSDALIVLKAASGDPSALELCGGAGATTTTLPPSRYTLSIVKQGDGTGSVRSSPSGVNCGTDCSEEYDAGTQVTLTATAAAGSKFTGWSGAVPAGCNASTAPCTVTMSRKRSVTAAFAKDAVAACPTTGPLTDLRTDCSEYGYFFVKGGIVAGMTSDGDSVAIVQTDGIDILTYLGPVTGQKGFNLTHIGTDEISPLPLLEPGSKGNISTDGKLLSWTAILDDESFVFANYNWFDTQPLLDAEVQVRAIAKSLNAGARGVLSYDATFAELIAALRANE